MLVALAFLTAASGCSEGKPTVKPTASESLDTAMCRQTLGPSGIRWIEQRITPAQLRFHTEKDFDKTRSFYYEKFREWRPDDLTNILPRSTVMCRAQNSEDHTKLLLLAYSYSYASFERNRQDKSRSTTPINNDVFVSSSPDHSRTFEVFIRCQIPGAVSGQKDQVPVIGRLIDDLTGEDDARVHYTHLLHSARVMVKALGCTNKPVVPAQPPASVK
ncbi:hypothetical protein [Streptomyces sudanensis]|uniref:hypothetical protein n=1 Tax=Streptomyces sudanensis TaxID=436397 RepID=UPI0020CB990C|nr:hypothetical protein [Streptomyces sudanensis]MCP9958664.1 hypothetical protein [Streptomyces sudanensis]MCQ0000841.1 hypothetical protein [Streptomyces sudanensis]